VLLSNLSRENKDLFIHSFKSCAKSLHHFSNIFSHSVIFQSFMAHLWCHLAIYFMIRKWWSCRQKSEIIQRIYNLMNSSTFFSVEAARDIWVFNDSTVLHLLCVIFVAADRILLICQSEVLQIMYGSRRKFWVQAHLAMSIWAVTRYKVLLFMWLDSVHWSHWFLSIKWLICCDVWLACCNCTCQTWIVYACEWLG